MVYGPIFQSYFQQQETIRGLHQAGSRGLNKLADPSIPQGKP